MLRLSREQFELVEQLVTRRHAAAMSGVLAEAWPALVERLQDRWPAFVEAAALQGRKYALSDPRDLARYASLWCVWGPAFETKPGFAWAAEILADDKRSASLKLHQLVHRTRDELTQRQVAATGAASVAGAGPALTTSQFDAALAKVQEKIGTLAAARAVFPLSEAPARVRACDIGGIDMMVAEPENLLEYRHAANGWHRVPAPKPADAAVKWTRAPEAPVELALVSPAVRGGPPARINLRIEAHAVCDVRVHPEVVHVGVEGRLAWKGRDTARLSLPVYAAAPLPVKAGESPPGIAAQLPPDAQSVSVSSGGMRDAGAPFGDVTLPVRVYPAAQWLNEIRHPAWPAMVWPAAAGDVEAPPPLSMRLESDGNAVDAAVWQRGWAGLHGKVREGMDRLYNEWARVLDGQATRLEVEVSPLVGQAGLTWGWRRTASSVAAMRAHGQLDLLAISVELRLSGELVDGSARSRIRLTAKGRSELRTAIEQLGDESAEGHDLKSAQRSFRFPFVLEIEPLAGAEPATLGAAAVAVPVVGALVGECGLRPRSDGAGHQWFFGLRVEPVTVVVETTDPLLGATRKTKTIFAPLTLADWSAG